MFNNKKQIVIYDGSCNLCNSGVCFLIEKDKKKQFQFVSQQSECGQRWLRKFGLPTVVDSLIFIHEEQYFTKSSAVLHILKQIGGVWKLLYGFVIVPQFLRDFIYNLIARNRFRLPNILYKLYLNK